MQRTHGTVASRRTELGLRPGSIVGRYRVLGELGRGGMGEVYEAYDPRLDRPIALKIHRTARRRRNERSRLLREAQALARLAHPNIIAIYDVGTIDSDVFIAMELVRGVDVRRWLQRGRASVDRIVEVFVQAGRGLAAAHRAGIIHRDIKPENILIGDDERVRVIDFGLARANEDRESTRASHEATRPLRTVGPSVEASQRDDLLRLRITRDDQVLGTPSYMAPELHTSLRFDERVDQFAFAVALWESLYGRRPFVGRTFEQLRANVMAGVFAPMPADAEVPKVPPRLQLVLRRALDPDPRRRFPTIEHLLEALEQRRRRSVGRWAIGAVGLAAATWLGLRAWGGPPPCDGAPDRLRGVWDARVRSDVRESYSTVDDRFASAAFDRVATSIDAYAERWKRAHAAVCEAARADPNPVTTDLRMTCLDRRLGELAALTEALSGSLDRATFDAAVVAVGKLGDVERCTDATPSASRHSPPSAPDLRHRIDVLADRLATVRTQANLGLWRRALDDARHLDAEARAVGFVPLQAEVRLQLAQLLIALGEAEEGSVLLNEAIALASEAQDDLRAAEAWLQVLWNLQGQARIEEAMFHVPAVEAAVRRAGEPPRLRAELASALGGLHLAAGRYAEAVESFERAVPLYLAAHGGEHDEATRARINLATGLRLVGRYDDALVEAERALQSNRERLGEEHPDVGAAYYVVGYVHSGAGQLDEALAAYQRALVIRELTLGHGHPSVAGTLHAIGSILGRSERYDEARRYLERAYRLTVDRLGEDHPDTAYVLDDLGALALAEGNLRAAVAARRRALRIREQVLAPTHPLVSRNLVDLGRIALELGDAAEARRWAERALGNEERAEVDDLLRGDLYLLLAQTLDRDVERGRVLSFARRARDHFERSGDLDGMRRAEAVVDRMCPGPGCTSAELQPLVPVTPR